MQARIPLLLLALTLAGCAAPDAGRGDRAEAPPGSSVLRVPLPSPYLSGYTRDLAGEVLTYHSPVPSIGTSLLVRSEARARSIAWESQAVPADFAGDDTTYVVMVGIDVNVEPRSFDVLVNGLDAFTIRNPTEASAGDTLVWRGEGGIRGEFRITLMDRYGDAMGFLLLTVPRGVLRPGEPVRFDVLGESAGARTWFMVFRDPLVPHVLIRNAPAVLRTAGGEAQILQLDLLDLVGGRRFRLQRPAGSADTVVALGHTRLTLPVPAVTRAARVPLELALGDHRDTVAYTVRPPRRMTLYLLHHTHLDIGYTHHQDEVERLQWSHLEEALRLGEASQDFPEGDRFVWNPEGMWQVDTYLRAHPGAPSERLLEGIRRGWIELDGMYAGLLTGLANEETLLPAFDAAREVSARTGVPIESEMLSDIPGFSWGLVEALHRSGIRYLSVGPNFGHRIGHFTEALGDRPFWWEGPSGTSRVLTWVSGGGYSWFHTGLGYDSISSRLDEEKVFRYVDQLETQEYPYDLAYLRYNIGSDTGPPDPTLAEAVRAWNRRYASPVVRISGTTEAFRDMERRYGDRLPTYRGDMTGHWEDGAASSARETALTRRTAESLVQTEDLARQRGVALDPALLAEAWRQVLLFWEHTWGSWNSISEPYSELTLGSWETKKGFAERAAALADELRAAALAGGAPAGAWVEVHNTLAWSRTDLVTLPAASSRAGDVIRAEDGSVLPSQRLATGELAFLARDVPARGMLRVRLEAGSVPRGAAPGVAGAAPSTRDAAVLETGAYRVEVDATSGEIRSLVHRETGRELVDGSQGGLARYVYVPGRAPAKAVGPGPARVAWKEAGPLVWSVEIAAPAPGLRADALTEVRLVEGLDRVDLSNRIAKAWVLEPEAVLFRFPFALRSPTARLDAPFGSFRPEVDQVPGACKNYFSVQRWVDLSEEWGGVTLTSVDAPLVQLGEVRTAAIVTGWLRKAEPSATLYSYVMNNYWETNYRAAQDDEVTFRYALRVHGPADEAAPARFGLEEARPLVVRLAPRPR
ncbi:MAG: hypothetical protein FIA95_02345 [Gemmatimonadetes bacterium]|nr:hypothetical protein [Gemmatimonadota bacterium]